MQFFVILFIQPWITLLIGFGLFSTGLSNHWSAVTLCQSQLSAWQKIARRQINTIKKLNPRAKALRLNLKSLQIKRALAIASGQAKLVGYYQIRIEKVKAKQRVLATKQKALLNSFRTLNRSMRHKVKVRLKSKSLSQFILQIKPVPKNSLSPSYVEKNNFKTKQATTARWSHFPFPVWKSMWSSKIEFNGQCSVSQAKRGLKWSPILVKAVL